MMKKLILISVLSLTISGKLFSQFVDENFEYPSGDSLQQHSWVTIGNVYTNRMLVTSPGLFFPDYINSGYGNAVTVDTTGQDVFRDFSVPVNSGNIYSSFLVNVKAAKSSGDYFMSLLSSTSTTALAGRVYIKDSSGSIAFGLSKTTESVTYTPARYFKDTTYLIILKYSINSGSANDSVSLFIYSPSVPVPSFEPAPEIGPKGGPGADLTDAGRFCLRQGTASSAPRLVFDGLYVTNSWDNSALPVELISFNSQIIKRNVILYWTTLSETNNSGFEIERLNVNYQNSLNWIKAGKINGCGTSATVNNYSFPDINLPSGKYKYRLKQIDFNGNTEHFYLFEEVSILNPDKFKLYQNYPNPFNPVTNIEYEIPSGSNVKLKIFDISGKEITEIVNSFHSAGYYSVKFDASEYSSGIYFATLIAESNNDKTVLNKKMLLIK